MGCLNSEQLQKPSHSKFSEELNWLQEYFQIPGMAVIVIKGDETLYEDYSGFADIDRRLPVDSTTTFPMASLTKIFTSVLIWQMVEDGKLSIQDPIVKYLHTQSVADSIKIEHAISHTSQGQVGKNFYYNNNRFMLLGEVIENVSGQNFKSNIYERIIDPLELEFTYLLVDSTQVAGEKGQLARPYFLGGDMVNGYEAKVPSEGFVDYGYSAAAGINSTVRDLARFGMALDDNQLMEQSSFDRMITPYDSNLPYGLGIFTQEFMDQVLIWGYGQYDCYSSLLLLIPSKDLVFVLAANNNLLSDPARLINGKLTNSLFALSFLKNFVFDLEEYPLLAELDTLAAHAENSEQRIQEYNLKNMLARALAASFMARYDEKESESSKEFLRHIFELYPDYKSYGDLTLLHNLSILKFMDTMRHGEAFSEFDKELYDIGTKLLQKDGSNPYANYYMANYYLDRGMRDSTMFHYRQITEAENFTEWWYTKEAQNWIEKNQDTAK